MNYNLSSKYLFHGNGPPSPTMEYIGFKRLPASPSFGLAGYGRPAADNNRATTTANNEMIGYVPGGPPTSFFVNIEYCTATTINFAFATVGDPTLVDSPIAYQLMYNTDGTVSFIVTDANGSAEIKMNDPIILEKTYSFTFTYGFLGSFSSQPSKANYMMILLQGRNAPTTTISDSPTATISG